MVACTAAVAPSQPPAAAVAAPKRRRQQQRWPGSALRRRGAAAALPPGLAASGGSVVDDMMHPLAALQQLVGTPQLLIPELALAAAAAFMAAAWPDRPRGWARTELLRVAPSTVAGLGVFAAQRIEAGTILGAYPGRPRSPAAMAAKLQVAPGAASYCFRTRSGAMLDPTDASGRLSPSPAPGLPWAPVDVTCAYLNEPPVGAGGCSVTVEDDPSDPQCGLVCVAARDIAAGEEIFMDYGSSFDRSGYAAGGGGGER